MVPTSVIEAALADRLATDPATLAPAALANHVHLIIEPFVPSPETDFTLLTEATFAGGADKNAGVGAQQSFVDPLTGNRVVQLLEPAGGWHWQATAAPAAPETVYGYVVTDNADAVTYGSGLLDETVEIADVGDAVDIDQVRFTIPVGMIT